MIIRFEERLNRYRPWFFAAAIYNAVWGSITILFPGLFFALVGMEPPNYPALWQVVGMFVLVYAPGYWWVARHPANHYPLILIGLAGKVLGPIGFLWSVGTNTLPLAFGWTIIANDLIWWPAFFLYLRQVAQLRGGWKSLFDGL